MDALDFAAFRSTHLIREPFPYLILPGFVKPEALAGVHTDYPRIDHSGSFPVEELKYGPAFAGLLKSLTGPEMRAAFEEKFGIDLKDRPTMITARGRCGTRDGNIHTDAVTKIITVLLYMNPHWESGGGCLRLLRSANDIEDVLAEVPPVEGTLVAFRRSDNSFHGHKPFIGSRRVIQLNWVTDRGTVGREILRHRASAWVKWMVGAFRRSA
jgi:SM-20-related protein